MRKILSHSNPNAFLLAAQLLQLILYAAFNGLHSQRAVISAFGALLLVLVVWVVNRSPARDWIAILLAAPALVLTLLSIFIVNGNLVVWSALLEGLLYFYAAGSLIVYMLNDDEVTVDELFAAGVTFTLFAWGYAYLYLVCQAWVPGSFVYATHPGQPLTFLELLFLSFTNLSATGLGDVVPVSAAARVIAMIEQFTGVGYVAVVVSRLVSLTATRRKARQG
jgi:hypothetical protein